MKALVLYAVLALGGIAAAHLDRPGRETYKWPIPTSPADFRRESHPPPPNEDASYLLHVPRGGSGQPLASNRDELTSVPLRTLTVQNVVLALRWTGEINRQLERSCRSSLLMALAAEEQESSQQRFDTLRGGARSSDGGILAENSYRVRDAEAMEPALTIYHTKSPRVGFGNSGGSSSSSSPSSSRGLGAAAWGPDLDLYLEHLVDVLGLNKDPSVTSFALNLALVYLDRSSSVETPRSSGAPACPFVTPRTVHRLLLAALVLAAQAVGAPGGQTRTVRDLHTRIEASLGVPYEQLHDLVVTMLDALGDLKTFVTPQQLRDFQALWEGSPLLMGTLHRETTDRPVLASSAATPPPPPPLRPIDELSDPDAADLPLPLQRLPRPPAIRVHSS